MSGQNLRKNFNDKVLDGVGSIYQMFISTATGTGLAGATAYKIGVCALDRSAGDWFLCTVSAGNGTWVKINA